MVLSKVLLFIKMFLFKIMNHLFFLLLLLPNKIMPIVWIFYWRSWKITETYTCFISHINIFYVAILFGNFLLDVLENSFSISIIFIGIGVNISIIIWIYISISISIISIGLNY